MIMDEVMTEVRSVRLLIDRENHYDMNKLIAHIQEIEKEFPDRLVHSAMQNIPQQVLIAQL